MRLSTTPRTARRLPAQALAEFSLFICLLLMIVITTLEFMPAIGARGATLDAAEAAVSRIARFVPGGPISVLCAQLSTAAQVQMSGATANGYGLPVSRGGCGAGNPSVTVEGSTAEGGTVRACIRYRYRPNGGLLWVFSRAPGALSTRTIDVLTFTYCGESRIDAWRTH